MRSTSSWNSRLAHDFFQLLALTQLVNDLVEEADFLGQRICDFLDFVSADGARDQTRVGVESGFGEELLEGRFAVDGVRSSASSNPVSHLITVWRSSLD